MDGLEGQESGRALDAGAQALVGKLHIEGQVVEPLFISLVAKHSPR